MPRPKSHRRDLKGDHLIVQGRNVIVRYMDFAMKTRVQKWGNSLALRIPKSLAEEMGLREDAKVELSLVDGNLVVKPIGPEAPRLDELLRGVTIDNLPGEWDTGPAVGNEAW